MPPTSKASSFLSLLLCLGCGHQDAIVGRIEGAGGSAGGAGGMPSYRSELETGNDWLAHNELLGSSTELGVDALGANGAELRFPGGATLSGPSNVTELESRQRFGFGTFRTRLAFGACQPTEEVVSAALGYFHDGSDENQNGIEDDEEIDLQVLCGAPTRLYLTVFTDHSPAEFRKSSRMVDFATGEVFDTVAPDSNDFGKVDTVPAWVRPELFAKDAWSVLGFEWRSTSLSFFIELDGARVTLWTLDDSARIPQRPVSFLYNLWHPETHWYPSSAAAAFPEADVPMHVDWFEHYAE